MILVVVIPLSNLDPAAMLKCALSTGLALALFTAPSPGPQDDQPGYDDTPYLPGGTWRVHDKARPRPSVVTPADGANLLARPPADATVLFDGTDLSQWKGGPWTLVDGALEVNGKGSIETVQHFGDVQLHVEWRSPPTVESESQGRGNSGVFFFGRYEVQVLDSFENPTYADGQAAALYGQQPPLVNACRAPGEWQSYDIVFIAPRFDGDELVSPAVVTVVHNGVLVQHAVELIGGTAHRAVATYAPHGPTGPIMLQDHGNPVRFRNIWVRAL